MIGENQSISDNDVFPPAGSENDDLGDVVGCQGFNTLVDGIGFGLVTAKSHDGEFLEMWVVREPFFVWIFPSREKEKDSRFQPDRDRSR